ncbi:MAG: radical SAM protein [Thermodesulfobacteria bacterium]|nr:radical SAM protein [Thermodesulfobacteriota bacterium]
MTRLEKGFAFPAVKGVYHPRFGDLSRLEAVRLETAETSFQPEGGTVFHVTVTGRCNARCEGCINVSLTCEDRREALKLFEADPEREVQAILTLAQEAPKPITVAFYGGEPFLAPEKMDLMRRLLRAALGDDVRFMVYTNGMLLDQVIEKYPALIEDLWLISFSIDGREEQHEAVRRGTRLSRIQENMARLKTVAPHVRTLVWSTLREEQSLYDCWLAFLELHELGLGDFFFYHFPETGEPFRDFEDYVNRYEAEFSVILWEFLERLRRGEIIPVVHLNELLTFMLTGYRRGHTACGAELAANFDLVGGRILACADLPPEFALGEITPEGKVVLRLEDLSFLAAYREPLGCTRCGIEPYCGGRCPVQALTGSPVRTLQYCQLLRLHVGLVKESLPAVRESLRKNGLSPEDLYWKAGFLARYTDVIP